MWILPILGYVGVILGFGFLTLAIGTSHNHPIPFQTQSPNHDLTS
jgi:hypothetical protein